MPQRVVLKFGSGILTNTERVDLDGAQLEALVAAVAGLRRAGVETVVVSSGAVAAGLPGFGLSERPTDVATLQACAAVGQTRLMHCYETLFSQYDLHVGQLLLTHDDLRTPERQRYVRNTIERLFAFDRAVPVINENDSVAVEELKYGDNDLLSADVACMIGADMLVLLTTVEGLFPPGSQQIVERVRADEMDAITGYATNEKGLFSVGGMASKLLAVKRAVDGGIDTWIASGRQPGQLGDLVAGRGHGTFFEGAGEVAG